MLVLSLLTTLNTSIAFGLGPDDLDNAYIEGRVRDSAGALIAGALVSARNANTGLEVSSVTDDQGRYRVRISAPGLFQVAATASGFRNESLELPLRSGQHINLDITLIPAGASEQATVTASKTALVDINKSAVGETILVDEIEALPLFGRDPLQMVLLLGGAAEAPLDTSALAEEGRGAFFRSTPEEAGIFSLTGAPATSNNITIDGLDNNDDRSARERALPSLESIAELQVITNQYAAEYGRASGGRINIRTRGGDNQARAEAHLFFADEALNANTFFRNARNLGRLPQHQTRESMLLSGPVVKNRILCLASYERLDISDFTEVRAPVPVLTNRLFPLPAPNNPFAPGSEVGLFSEELSTPETRNFLNGRADLNLSGRHSATVRADVVIGSNRRGFPGGARLPESILIEARDSHSISVTDSFSLSGGAINQARFQASHLTPRLSPVTLSTGVIINAPSRVVAGGFSGSEGAPAFIRQERRIQVQDTVSLVLGNHLIKAGADVQSLRSRFTDLFATTGAFEFDTVADFLENRPGRFTQRFDTESVIANDVIGIFVQDEWKIRPNLTLSYGGRWDSEAILRDRDNFSPRLSVAWDPFKGEGRNGRTVIRAGVGIFYNRALLRTLDDFSIGRSKRLIDSDLSPQVLAFVRFPNPISDSLIIDRFAVHETEFLRRVDSSLEIPYTVQSGLGFERQLGGKILAGVDYVFTRGAHLWRETNINAPRLPAGFADFGAFLLSRDFDNRVNAAGSRPLASTSADVVRFDLGTSTASTAGAVRQEQGVRILTLGLNAPRSGNIRAALNAIRFLRHDPSLEQVEQLESTGSSFYHGAVFTVRGSIAKTGSFRVAYTISKLIDEGTTNTASPQILIDRRADRALSLQDQRHRLSITGSLRLPLLGVDLAPALSFGSSRPFNIGAGFDRNLNDIQNDRPLLLGNLSRPEWRRPGASESDISRVRNLLTLSPIGLSGDLPRNYGRGPGTQSIALRISRAFDIGEKLKLRPAIDVFNLFNTAIFSFGAEFIDRDDVDFLVARRTQRPRMINLSLKIWF